jgi:hypothetical protein
MSRWAVPVCNIFTSKIDVFVVDAVDALTACRGVVYDLLGSDSGINLMEHTTVQSLLSECIDYDLAIGIPREADVINRPSEKFFADDEIASTIEDVLGGSDVGE